MSPLALTVLRGCRLKGHMTLWVINTWQCCCLAWGSVTQETAQSRGIGLAARDAVICFLFEMQFTASSLYHTTAWRAGTSRCACVSLWCTHIRCIYFYSSCIAHTNQKRGHAHRSHCCDPAPGAGTRSQAPLTGGSTISHSSADGPVYSAREGERELVNRRHKKLPHQVNRHHLVWLQRHKLAVLAERDGVQLHCLWHTQTDARKSTETPSQLNRDCRAFRDLLNQTGLKEPWWRPIWENIKM